MDEQQRPSDPASCSQPALVHLEHLPHAPLQDMGARQERTNSRRDSARHVGDDQALCPQESGHEAKPGTRRRFGGQQQLNLMTD